MSSLDGVLARVPAPLVLLDVERRVVTYANEAADGLTGRPGAGLPLAEWAVAAGLEDVDGRPLDGTGPLERVAQGFSVHGEGVRRRTPDGVESLVASGSPLPPIGDLPRLGVVSLHPASAPAPLGGDVLQERAIRALGHSLCITDTTQPDEPVVYVNPAFEAMTGYAAAEVLGRNCRFLQGPGTDRAAVARLRAALAADRPVTVLLLNERKDGAAFWNEVSITAVHDAAGRPTHRVGVQLDVTDRVTAQLERDALVVREQAARADAERAQARLHFLSQASVDFDQTLSVPTVLERLARLAVRGLADWALVDLVDEDGRVQRECSAHADEDLDPEVRLLRVHSRVPAAVVRVVDDGRPLVVDDAPLSLVVGEGEDRGQRSLARELGHGSVMVVPLRSRGRVLGALSLVSTRRHAYGDEDVRLAVELARRAATSVDNAQVFSARDRVARVLQASLLPPSLPVVPGLSVAGRYQPGGTGSQVGGDFYDLFATRTGHGVVIGDVCGRGPDAAAVTGLARYTVRAVAMSRDVPSEVLGLLNRAVLAESIGERFLTAAYAHVEAADGHARLLLAVGGHPLPLVLRAGGEVEAVGTPGSLLGVLDDVELSDVEVRLGPGDALVLHTDGVLEAAGPQGQFGEARLRTTLAGLRGGSADEVAGGVVEAVLDHVSGDTNDDDLAVLVLRVDAPRAPV